MSVETNETLNVVKSERAWCVKFDTKKSQPYEVIAYQEVTHTHSGEDAPFSKVRMDDVKRTLTEADGTPTAVLAETVTLANGDVISMAQILEAGSLFSDKWRAEDKAE